MSMSEQSMEADRFVIRTLLTPPAAGNEAELSSAKSVDAQSNAIAHLTLHKAMHRAQSNAHCTEHPPTS